MFVLGVQDLVSGKVRGVAFAPEEVRALLDEALAASPRLRPVAALSPEAYRAELLVALAAERETPDGGTGQVLRAVQVELTLSRPDDSGERVQLRAVGEAFQVVEPESSDREADFRLSLRQAIQRAVVGIEHQVEAGQLPLDSLRQRLHSPEASERLDALRVLRDRPEPELVPDVIEALKDPSDEVVLEAVGVLVAQRDPRAAQSLIRLGQGRDPVFLLQIITAMTEIGGPVAKGYLFTLSMGHLSGEIRQQAAEGLKLLEERSLTAAPSPVPGSAAMDVGAEAAERGSR